MGIVALGSCSDPEQRTDLRPEGPPDVLAITVMSDLAGGLYESAIYCKTGDEKRPGLVGVTDFTTLQICPDDLSQPAEDLSSALYGAWYVRVVFDELLDPKVEDLVPILDEDGLPTETFCGTIETTRPVVLRCEDADGVMQEIPYDGYYVPNGNAVTWPLGPSLVITPFDTSVVPPGGQCTVQIRESVVDKDGIAVPDTQAFPFQVQDLEIFDFFPDGEEVPTTDGFWEVVFNAPIDPTSVCNPDCIADPDFVMTIDGQTVTDPALIQAFPDAGGLVDVVTAFEPGHDYTLTIPAGATILEGVRTSNPDSLVVGNPADPANENNQVSSFSTADFDIIGIEGGSSTPIAPIDAAIFIDFNSPMDATSLAATEFTLTGPGGPVANAGFIVSNGTFIVFGDFLAGESYTFTLNAGATLADLSMTPNVYTNAAAVTQMFTTQPLDIDEIGPDGESIAIGDGPAFFLSFNQYMDCTTFTAADFMITPALANTTITCDEAFGPDSFVEVVVSGDFVEGTTYTFTLAANAAIDSVFGENFVNPSAQAVTLQVVSDPEPTEPNACFVQNL